MGFRLLQSNETLANCLVVDNSVMMRWLFNDGSKADQQYAQVLLEQIQENKLQVIRPYIWVYESAFVVNYYIQQKQISPKQGSEFLEKLFDVGFVIRGDEKPQMLFEFANKNKLSAYDASYVLLALSLNCPLATLDKKMMKVAKKLK